MLRSIRWKGNQSVFQSKTPTRFRRKILISWQQLRALCSSQGNAKRWTQPDGHDTGISIYHPLMKEKVPLVLHHEKVLNWYACGPTVYDSAHIGHASSYVRQDVIRRILQGAFNIDCMMVMGVTDVDDKIILKSQETGKSVEEVTSFYQAEFFSDMSSLGVLPATAISRVTDNICVIVSFIQGLERQGVAYAANDGSVYFDVEKYGQYGVFSNPPVDAQQGEGASVKRSPRDFALWKASKPGEIKWSSPWGEGRPGWHIECSAMASELLGPTFDLHSGGEDLMFPHHENELAQSCAYHGTRQWVNYWLHTGKLFLSGQDEKMSKSLKNTISVSDFLKSYTSNHFRMLCLLSSYRKAIEFSEGRMTKATSTVNTFNNFLTKCDAYVKGQNSAGEIDEPEVYARLQEAKVKVVQAYRDDFNTPQALATLVRLLKVITPTLEETAAREDGGRESTPERVKGLSSPVRSPTAVTAVSLFVQRHLDLLGLEMGAKKAAASGPPSSLQATCDSLVDLVVTSRDSLRQAARDKHAFLQTAESLGIPQNKAGSLFKKAYQSLWSVTDQMRAQLLKRADVEVRDGKEVSTWSRVETVKELERYTHQAQKDKELKIK